MNPTDLLLKTEKGQEEIRSRKFKLAAKARMLLLLVDGQQAAADLAAQAARFGLPAGALEDLVSQGFIGVIGGHEPEPAAAPAPAAPGRHAHYRTAQAFMNESIVNALGMKSFFFTLKIEKTANVEDLRLLMGDYAKAMTKALGEHTAAVFVARMNSLLG